MEKLDAFLTPTKYCNSDHPKIINLAQKITKNCRSEKEKITSLFYWVKENIKFKFDFWGIDAVTTLKKRTGMCTNKSNLLIALLRSLRIPAGFGRLKIITNQFYGALMCPIFQKLVSHQSTHIYVGLFYQGKWIKCDPSVDSDLKEALTNKSPFAEISGFDLKEKEMNKIKGVIKREEFFANIDQDLEKPAKHAKGKTLQIINSYLVFLRENKKKIKTISLPEKLEESFIRWLKKEKKNLFYFLQSLNEKFKR